VRIEILDDAQEDLIEGFRFYEKRENGVGAYFLDCLFSDIDSLVLFAGIHQIVYGYHRSLSKRFLSPFTMTSWTIWFVCTPYWIAVGIRRGSENVWDKAAKIHSGKNSKLYNLPNVIITPRIAGITSQKWPVLLPIFQDNLRRFIDDRPLRNVVDKKRGY
jgi:hypothetical protein